ncbi:MAG: QueT transporter family protein [Ruthenibacterium sp.]
MRRSNTKKLVRCALIAALYAAISLALTPITYGMMQARISEALTLLPILTPDAIAGVALGCFLTNLAGMFTGANILGALDLVFGTAATLCAALCTRRLRHVRTAGLPVLAAVPPVLLNAVVVGAELTWLTAGTFVWPVFLVQAAWVALGQTLSCFVLGLPLIRLIEKTPALRAWFED